MTLPLTLPAWVPSWLPFLVLVAAVLYLLVFLVMPFSVFGIKSRLDSLEAELDEIHAEIRRLALRLPEPIDSDGYDDAVPRLPLAEEAEEAGVPPIPPAPDVVAPAGRPGATPRRFAVRHGAPPPAPEAPRRRTEPRLDWPR